MSKVIVIEFVSLDGVTHDPDGSDGSPQGGSAATSLSIRWAALSRMPAGTTCGITM